MTSLSKIKKILPCWVLCLLLLGGCQTLFGYEEDKPTSETEKKEVVAEDTTPRTRIPVMALSSKIQPDKELAEMEPLLGEAITNNTWVQAGGSLSHALPQLALKNNDITKVDKIWSSDIGDGSSSSYRILSQPLVDKGKVFTMDALGLVSSFDLKTGDLVWQQETMPEGQDEAAMGGGIAMTDETIFATTGFGEVLALSAKDGKIIWRKTIGKPLRAAPTVAGDKVFVITIDNELKALAARDGTILWHHNGMSEKAALMGASSPAFDGNNIIVTYSSGEIFSLRASNGRLSWMDVLAVPAHVGALPAIADIRALPVVADGRVYAISHSGVMGSFSLRTGERLWEVDTGGINTPALAENMIFVISNDNRLMAVTRSTRTEIGGRIVWSSDLQRFEDPSDLESEQIAWFGPVLAGGHLWLASSKGDLAAFEPKAGKMVFKRSFAKAFFQAPIVANGALLVVSDEGKLIALQ